MPRDLADVADYYLPSERSGPSDPVRDRRASRRSATRTREHPARRAALPIVTLPIADDDVVRAAFAWNLAVESARLGVSATLLAPSGEQESTLWPSPGPGPVGSELMLTPARGLADLDRAAVELAEARAVNADAAGGVVFVRVPPGWLDGAGDGPALLRWVLLFASTDPRDLLDTYTLAKRALAAGSDTRVGVTIHGVRSIGDAERAFTKLADVTARHLGRQLESYGLLVDDLHVYRAIVARRPIGLEHPQSRAAHALRDVARLVLEDAASMELG